MPLEIYSNTERGLSECSERLLEYRVMMDQDELTLDCVRYRLEPLP